MSENEAGNAELTPEQVENWRRTLLPTLGPYALIARASEIQRIRDAMQRAVDQIEEKGAEE